MPKIDKADLFECRYYAGEDALAQERINGLNEQERHLSVVQALIQERREVQQKVSAEVQQKMVELMEAVRQKYGVDQNQIDWETGEINPVQETTAEASAGAGGVGRNSGMDATTGVGGSDGTTAESEAETPTTESRGAENSGPPVG